jgi:uncharacterized protein
MVIKAEKTGGHALRAARSTAGADKLIVNVYVLVEMTMMNRRTLLLTAALLAALLTTFALPAQAAERLITVTGHGTVAVAPDTATIRIGVTSQGKTAREASAANAQQMTKVLSAIEQSGIAKKDIQTSRLSLQPQYDAKNGTNRLLGFQVTNQITVRIHNIDNLPSLLDKAIAAGANEMSGIEFLVSGESKLLDEARADAIADAHRKAMLYAKAAGAKVGKVVAIVEQGASPPPRPFQALRASGGAVPVAPGEQMLRATVTVSYELGQ